MLVVVEDFFLLRKYKLLQVVGSFLSSAESAAGLCADQDACFLLRLEVNGESLRL